MRRMIVRSVLGAAFLAILSCRGEAAPDRTEVGTVDKVQAQAEAIHDGATRALSPAAAVLYADLLRTGRAARLHAELKDGTQLTLGENGRMLVDDFVYKPGAEDNRLSLRVVRGAFLFVGGKTENGKHAAVTIQTPVATLGVRGTTVWGGYIDGRYRVLVLSGEVQVKTTGGAVTLHAGQATAIKSPHDAPTAPHGWSKSRTARAVATVSFAP